MLNTTDQFTSEDFDPTAPSQADWDWYFEQTYVDPEERVL